MFRTTTPRTRALLSVPVAIAAAAAVSIPLTGVASANHSTPVASLVMTPESDSAAVGTCNQYTVEVDAPGGGPVAGEVVDVIVTETPASGTATVTFCQTPNSATPPVTPATPNAGQDEAFLNGRKAEFTTDANGLITFGISSTDAVSLTVVAFIDNDNDDNDDDTMRDQSTKTFTAGGTQNAETLSATPMTDTNIVGETHTVNITVRNAAGDPIPGVPVEGNIVSGPNAGQVLDCEFTGPGIPTNQAGNTACTYTGNAVGTDTIVFWVNQANADNNIATADTDGPNPDAGEPSVTVTKTWNAVPPAGLVIDVTCADVAGPAAQEPEVCQNPLTETTEVFTATVTAPDGPDVGESRDPASGILVRFTVNDPAVATTANPDATVNPTSCTTDSTGKCSTTLTKTNPGAAANNGQIITVTGSVAPNGPSDSATKQFLAAASNTARNINLQPDTANTAPGAFRTWTATVTDRFGNPVGGVEVTFTESGTGRFANGAATVTAITNSAGQATVETTSASTEVGTQTITATISGYTSPTATRGAGASDDECEQVAGTTLAAGGSPDPNLTAGNCSDTSTNTIGSPTPSASSASPTGSGAPTTAPPTGNPNCTVGSPTTVSLASNVTQITAGNAPTLTGTVLNASNQPCASTAITIYKKSYGEAGYTALATVSTDQNGKFTLVVRPLTQTAYGANTANNAVRSNIVVIRVYTRMNLVSPAVPVPANTARPVTNPVTFTGNMLPGYSNVAVGLGTFVNGRFVVLQQTVTNSRGEWSLTRTLRPGTGVYVVFTSAHQGTDKGAKSITLSVR